MKYLMIVLMASFAVSSAQAGSFGKLIPESYKVEARGDLNYIIDTTSEQNEHADKEGVKLMRMQKIDNLGKWYSKMSAGEKETAKVILGESFMKVLGRAHSFNFKNTPAARTALKQLAQKVLDLEATL